MSKKCQHEADWHSASVAFQDDEYCMVALPCLHCSECAFADLGPKHFKWDDDDDPPDDDSLPPKVGPTKPADAA
jgi:hypothetical protein